MSWAISHLRQGFAFLRTLSSLDVGVIEFDTVE